MKNPTSIGTQITPKPPGLHWGIVLALSIVTLGLFACLWAFRQARFARKIDPGNKATLQIGVSFALVGFAILLSVMNAITVARGGESSDFGATGTVMAMFTFIMFVSGYLEIRKALTRQYGIQMNEVLTVILNVYYVQYHLTRIVKLQLPLAPQLPDTVQPISDAGRASA